MSVVRGSILTVALMASGAAYAGSPGWSVSESSGPVFVVKPGLAKTSAVTRGAALSAGDIISTGKGGRAVIVRGGEYLTVAPNTKVQLTEPKAGAFTQIVQSFGNVVFKIQKKTTPHFQVNTPYLAAVVKGTTFSVTVTPAGASVQVTEGLVQVQSLDGLASRFVSPGEIGMISSAAPGQLSILGAPDAPAGAATVIGAPAAAPTADAAAGAPAETVTPTVTEIAEVRIASPIGEGTVNLAAQTGGIVSGNSSLSQAAVVEAVIAQSPAGAPSDTAAIAVDLPVVAEAMPVVETPPARVAEATPPAPVVEAPATVVAEVAPPVPVVEAAPVLVADVSPPAPVVEAPATIVAEVAPPAPVVDAPPVLVAEVTPPAPVAEAPATIVAEVAPPAPVVEAPPVLVAEVTPPAPVLEAPAAVVADATLAIPATPVLSAPPTQIAEVAPPAAEPAQPPVLVAVLETPSAASPSVPSQAADNVSSGSNAASGSGSSGSKNVASGGSDDKRWKNPTSLSELLKALQEAAKQVASASKKGS